MRDSTTFPTPTVDGRLNKKWTATVVVTAATVGFLLLGHFSQSNGSTPWAARRKLASKKGLENEVNGIRTDVSQNRTGDPDETTTNSSSQENKSTVSAVLEPPITTNEEPPSYMDVCPDGPLYNFSLPFPNRVGVKKGKIKDIHDIKTQNECAMLCLGHGTTCGSFSFSFLHEMCLLYKSREWKGIAILPPIDQWEHSLRNDPEISCREPIAAMLPDSKCSVDSLKYSQQDDSDLPDVVYGFAIDYQKQAFHTGKFTIESVRKGLMHWAESVYLVNMTGVLIHSRNETYTNQSSDATLQSILSSGRGAVTLRSIHPDVDPRYRDLVTVDPNQDMGLQNPRESPFGIRFIALRDIILNEQPCRYCLTTDASDVMFNENAMNVMSSIDTLRKQRTLFVGDELILHPWQWAWVKNQVKICYGSTGANTRGLQHPGISNRAFEKERPNSKVLLNAGSMGGHRSIFSCFLDDMVRMLAVADENVCDMAAVRVLSLLPLEPIVNVSDEPFTRFHGQVEPIYKNIFHGAPFNCNFRKHSRSKKCAIAHK
jgi:hypothetical protein